MREGAAADNRLFWEQEKAKVSQLNKLYVKMPSGSENASFFISAALTHVRLLDRR